MAKGPYFGAIGLCFFLITTWLSITWEEHPSFERPVHSALVAFFIAGVVLVVISRTTIPTRAGRGRGGKGSESHAGYSAVPLQDLGILNSSRSSSPVRDGLTTVQLSPQKRRQLFLLLVICTVIRVGTLRKISEASQCSVNSLEIMALPIIFGIYDYITNPSTYTKDDERDAISNTVFDDMIDAVKWARIRYAIPTILLSVGTYLTSSRLPSTYICAEVLRQRNFIIFLQFTGLILDSIIILGIWHLLRGSHDDRHRTGMLGYFAISSTILLSATGIIYLVFHPSDIAASFTTSSAYKLNIFVDGMLLAILFFCLGYLSTDLRPFAVVVIVAFMATFVPLVKNAWKQKRPFPPESDSARIIGFAWLYIGFISFIVIYKSAEASKEPQNIARRVHGILYGLLFAAFVYTEITYFWRNNEVGFHPVRLLSYQSQIDADKWSKQASTSVTLRAAVTEYQLRYHRLPPPNFDKWFAFAKERHCSIIDDYDQIYNDLLPFWGVDPSQIRKRSTISHTESGFATIMINRGGGDAVHVSPVSSDFGESISMIKAFAQWLPQMQIVLNPSSLPQVALPFSRLASLQATAHYSESRQQQPETLITTWAPALEWDKPLETPESGPPPPPSALHLSRWDAFVGPSCPSFSSAHTHPHTSRTLCTSCYIPHSIGQFLHNVSLSLNPCYQPDLRSLSSFLSSPATAPITGYPADVLVPIFSSRKVQGYNDILFPFPNTYIPASALPLPNQNTFSEKSAILFWRGQAPPSGLGAHAWQGVSEQRLVALSHEGPPGAKVPLLLPLDKQGEKYVYEYVKLASIAEQLEVDARFTGVPPESCPRAEECQMQRQQFGTGANVSDAEEERFSHRFVLTTDTAEPGEFLRDLRSNSVAVRAGVFRSWYEDRVTPWLDYIPVDTRWQGLHSTLAYFVGLMGTVRGKEVKLQGKFNEGAWVAAQGKNRVEAVIRQEDAEVYLFRLLLEWGRVVDDKREELGFKLD